MTTLLLKCHEVTILRNLLIFLFLLTLSGCELPADSERPKEPLLHNVGAAELALDTTPLTAVKPLTAKSLLNEGTDVHGFETTAEAVTVWRRAREQRPTLLLLSNNPHLKPVPEAQRKAAVILFNNASPENIRLATTDRNPAPLLLPGMAIDAALRSGWFRELAWALPLRDPAQELDLDQFKAQLTSSGIADDSEADGISLSDRVLHGTLRGTPLTVASLPRLQGLPQPVIVHIDLSYFQPLYKNEVSTPLLSIIHDTFKTLQKMHLNTLAVTFSYGHLDSQIALDVRFLGDIIKVLIEDPARLDQPIPINWQRQRDTLYLANFFQKDKVRELFEAQELDEPNAAYVKFNLYRSAVEHKEATQALDYLAQAVSLDPMYALEYSELSNIAYEKGRPDEALHMLQLAAAHFHYDPFLKLQMAQLANEIGNKEKSLELLNKIRNLNWSQTYYPEMQQYLADLTTFVQVENEVPVSGTDSPKQEASLSEPPQAPEVPDQDSRRQRTLHPAN